MKLQYFYTILYKLNTMFCLAASKIDEKSVKGVAKEESESEY